jgi:hypothetical protein
MKADWEFEVGGDAPVIDAYWAGFVDLCTAPERVCELPEISELAELGSTLLRLNSVSSPVWTAKCDFWPVLEPGEFDTDELDAGEHDAPPGCALHGAACYIDILPRADGAWSQPPLAEAACRRLCELLGRVPLRCCRADLIIRRALLVQDRMDLGITAYIVACGATEAEAARTLSNALAAFADAICDKSTLQ